MNKFHAQIYTRAGGRCVNCKLRRRCLIGVVPLVWYHWCGMVGMVCLVSLVWYDMVGIVGMVWYDMVGVAYHWYGMVGGVWYGWRRLVTTEETHPCRRHLHLKPESHKECHARANPICSTKCTSNTNANTYMNTNTKSYTNTNTKTHTPLVKIMNHMIYGVT